MPIPAVHRARARAQQLIRNTFCGVLASALVAFGCTRRARKRIVAMPVVTSIYFHNPNRRLFKKCVLWLKKNGYHFLSLSEVLEIVQGNATVPSGAVWLTFDDGFQRLLEAVLPVVREQRVPLTIFIPSGILEGDGLFPWLASERSQSKARSGQTPRREAMTVEELQQISRYSEVSIGSHTVTHAITAGLPAETLRSELLVSKQKLEQWTGRPVVSFAYPVGQMDGREFPLLQECGYSLAVTTEAALLRPGVHHYLVPRFHVGDEIPFVEAVCNMVGIWRPAITPLKAALGSFRPKRPSVRAATAPIPAARS